MTENKSEIRKTLNDKADEAIEKLVKYIAGIKEPADEKAIRLQITDAMRLIKGLTMVNVLAELSNSGHENPFNLSQKQIVEMLKSNDSSTFCDLMMGAISAQLHKETRMQMAHIERGGEPDHKTINDMLVDKIVTAMHHVWLVATCEKRERARMPLRTNHPKEIINTIM
jgi:hypothetical protein